MRITALFVLLATLPAFAADWPQLHGPARDGHTAEKGLLDAWPARGPAEVWRRDVGAGYAAPVVVADRLILFHRVGGDDLVECLSAATGKPLWKVATPTTYRDDYGKGDGPRSTPTVAGGSVYTLGPAGQILCLDLKTGKKLWNKDLLADYTVKKGYFGVGTSPLAEGKNLLVNVGGEDGAGVVALDLETGKEAWRATNHEASYSSPIAATVGGVRHVFFFTREGLASIDPANGKVRFTRRWRSRIDASVNAASPVLLGGKYLFLSSCYDTGAILFEIEKDGVKEVWKGKESLNCHFSTPVAVGDQLYGFEGRQEEGGQLRCIDWKTGKVRWTENAWGCGSAIAAGDKLFVLGEDGDLGIVKADAGKYRELARASVLTKPVRAPLALANGMLYARDGRKLVCWKTKE
jgi:outer membrane protein assembly factor BamB